MFHLTDNTGAPDFAKFTEHRSRRVAPPQAKDPVEYAGSTTGDKYNDGSCSPFQVTWRVSSACTPVNIKSINSWCGTDKNAFKENHAHGVRRLVKDAKLLSPVK